MVRLEGRTCRCSRRVVSLGTRGGVGARSPGGRWRELDATCCFVDISGFTALSERLARRGRIGAEELTEVLNHVFGRMLGIAYDKGGAS